VVNTGGKAGSPERRAELAPALDVEAGEVLSCSVKGKESGAVWDRVRCNCRDAVRARASIFGGNDGRSSLAAEAEG